MKLIGYSIHGCWGPRQEEPATIANRFLSLVDRLALIDPVFGDWIYTLDPQPIKLDVIRNDMAKVVERHVSRADDGEPTPIDGYSIYVVNTDHAQPRSIDIYVKAGVWGHTAYKPYYINSASIETSHNVVPDPAILGFSLFRSALLALAESFDMTWCSAYPHSIMKLWKNRYFRIGWMSYISPRFAPLITPPQSAIVECRPNGALLMSATNETFVTANPRHLAVAREIEAALAPLNALPWPPDAESESESANK